MGRENNEIQKEIKEGREGRAPTFAVEQHQWLTCRTVRPGRRTPSWETAATLSDGSAEGNTAASVLFLATTPPPHCSDLVDNRG